MYVNEHVHVCTVSVIKKLTEAVPKQYRINTERRANLDSNVYMYAVRCGAVRCGTVRAVRCARAVRDAGRALHARAIALAGAVRYGTDF